MSDIRAVKRNISIQHWAAIIADRNTTDFTVKEYCTRNNLSRNSYFYWLKQLRQEATDSVDLKSLKESPLIHCDETPFIMSGEKDATDPQSRDYMWIYHSPGTDNSKKIYLYDYGNGSRSTEVIKNFFCNYKGIIVSDGYVSYHTLGKANDLNPF